jgi:hypothetical protein
MKIQSKRIFPFFVFLAGFLPFISAQNTRSIPLDLFLIIDGSVSLENSKNDVISWVNDYIVDRVLVDGDQVYIWTAGDNIRLIHSGTISGVNERNEIKDKLKSLDTSGTTANFTAALTEASQRSSRTDPNRLPLTMLVASSAAVLHTSLTTNSREMFRWSRSERYERWQVFFIGLSIGPRVRQAAQDFMAGR